MATYHRPVCSRCEVEMRPFKNGVQVIDYASYGAYQIWEADEWACPGCDNKIVIGFGQEPFCRNFSPDFPSVLKEVLGSKLVRHNREFIWGGR